MERSPSSMVERTRSVDLPGDPWKTKKRVLLDLLRTTRHSKKEILDVYKYLRGNVMMLKKSIICASLHQMSLYQASAVVATITTAKES